MQPPLASHLMLEMFHRIGDENLRARNSCIFQRPVENAPRRADKRLAGEIFLVTRLLADEHEVGRPAPLAWDRLCRVLVERTARAFVLRLGKLRQRSDGRRKVEIELRFLSHRALQSLPPAASTRATSRRFGGVRIPVRFGYKEIFISSLRARVTPAIGSAERRPAGAPQFRTS